MYNVRMILGQYCADRLNEPGGPHADRLLAMRPYLKPGVPFKRLVDVYVAAYAIKKVAWLWDRWNPSERWLGEAADRLVAEVEALLTESAR